MRGALCLCLGLSAGSALADEQAPAPEFAIKASFEEIVARLFARDCTVLSFDEAAFDRHQQALLAEHAERGYRTDKIDQAFAPIPPEGYEPFFDALMHKYGLKEESPDAAFCAAGAAEAREGTALGQLLEVSGQ